MQSTWQLCDTQDFHACGFFTKNSEEALPFLQVLQNCLYWSLQFVLAFTWAIEQNVIWQFSEEHFLHAYRQVVADCRQTQMDSLWGGCQQLCLHVTPSFCTTHNLLAEQFVLQLICTCFELHRAMTCSKSLWHTAENYRI